MADRSDSHEVHDPVRVAALVDRPVGPPGDDPARAWIDDCPDCASLYRDLLALSAATHALPGATRARDFQISAADAARLTEASARHARHDPTVVAALVDRSVEPADRAAGEELLAACTDCVALFDDLSVLSAAIEAMPTPPRPRDYLLTADDVARLRPVGWRRWLPRLGGPADVLSRPLAIGFTTIGLVGILVVGVPSILPTGSATSMLQTIGSSVSNDAAEAARVPAAGSAASGTGSATSGTGRYQEAPAPNVSVIPDTAGGVDHPNGLAGAAIASDRPSDTTDLAADPQANPASSPAADTKVDGSSDLNESSGSLNVDEPADGSTRVLGVSGLFLVTGLGLFLLRRWARRPATG